MFDVLHHVTSNVNWWPFSLPYITNLHNVKILSQKMSHDQTNALLDKRKHQHLHSGKNNFILF